MCAGPEVSRRTEELDFDPGEPPMGFERAMEPFTQSWPSGCARTQGPGGRLRAWWWSRTSRRRPQRRHDRPPWRPDVAARSPAVGPVAEKYKEAYAMDPRLEVAAVRAQRIILPTAYPSRNTAEGERRANEAFDLLARGRPFFERYAPCLICT